VKIEWAKYAKITQLHILKGSAKTQLVVIECPQLVVMLNILTHE
jgi:hypothetical protein